MSQDQPKHRFFYNDDGDRAIFLIKGPFHPQQLNWPVDVLLGTGVTTLVYCANFGSDQAYYPSQVASPLGWRDWSLYEGSSYFERLYKVGKMLREQGIDVLGTIMRRAKDKGLEFVPSLRMNDGHFCQKIHPRKHPATGRFWMEHQDLIIRPGAEWTWPGPWMDFLLDFTHQEVRDYRMAQIYELIDGYAADGFEMDFTRHYRLFPPGEQKPQLVTNMVRQARERLDQREARVGKDLMLIVRVPPSLKACEDLGVDVVSWMREGLVDYVVPSSPSRLISFDMPITEFVEAAEGTGVRIAASPDSAGATVETYRAAFSNYYAMGQDDSYLFNFFTNEYPFSPAYYSLLRDLTSPDTLYGRDKVFRARPESWAPTGVCVGTAIAEIGEPYQVMIYIGDDIQRAASENIIKSLTLSLGVSGFEPTDPLQIALNGQALCIDEAQVSGSTINFAVGPDLLKQGYNTVTFMLTESLPRGDQLSISAVDLHVHYDISGVAKD